MGEFELIKRYFSGLDHGPITLIGLGDDAAVMQIPPNHALVVSVDSSVVGVHFLESTFAEAVAYRAVASAVSDLAAMGAKPLGMTLAITLPEVDEWWLRTFSEGLCRACADFQCPLIGGDTTRGPLTISITVHGLLPEGKALTRDGAKPGDDIYVSGTLGNAAGGLKVELNECEGDDFELNEKLHDAWLSPTPRLELGQTLLPFATSCIDISDGLLADLGHIIKASQVGAELNLAEIPLSEELVAVFGQDAALAMALKGGEVYELCFTLPAGTAAPKGCCRIGKITDGTGIETKDGPLTFEGWTHF
jgi:thiamine-monophosphate kinase